MLQQPGKSSLKTQTVFRLYPSLILNFINFLFTCKQSQVTMYSIDNIFPYNCAISRQNLSRPIDLVWSTSAYMRSYVSKVHKNCWLVLKNRCCDIFIVTGYIVLQNNSNIRMYYWHCAGGCQTTRAGWLEASVVQITLTVYSMTAIMNRNVWESWVLRVRGSRMWWNP